MAISSSLTILMTCCPGERLFRTSSSDSPHPDLFDKILDNLEVDISLKEHQANFAQRLLDIIFRHYSLAAELLEYQFKLIGEIIKHPVNRRDFQNLLHTRQTQPAVKG